MKVGKINMLLLLCTITLISIGFSSWYIGNSSYQLIGLIQADNLIDSRRYVILNREKGNLKTASTTLKTGIDTFKYNSYGFVIDDEIGYKGEIKYYLKFLINEFYTDFNYDYSNLSFLLNYSKKSDQTDLIKNFPPNPTYSYIFESKSQGNYTGTLNPITQLTTTTTDNSISTVVSLKEFNRNNYETEHKNKCMYIELAYVFDFTDKIEQYETFYNELKSKTINFALTVYIIGCDNYEV